MTGIINWEKMLELAYGKTTDDRDVDPAKFWDQFGYMYDKMSRMEKSYTKHQVDAMILEHHDRVLDVGCGTGRLCVPISKKSEQRHRHRCISEHVKLC